MEIWLFDGKLLSVKVGIDAEGWKLFRTIEVQKEVAG